MPAWRLYYVSANSTFKSHIFEIHWMRPKSVFITFIMSKIFFFFNSFLFLFLFFFNQSRWNQLIVFEWLSLMEDVCYTQTKKKRKIEEHENFEDLTLSDVILNSKFLLLIIFAVIQYQRLQDLFNYTIIWHKLYDKNGE